jgi:hypothetical protein
MCTVTREYIADRIALNDRLDQFIGRALLVLFKRQTEGEKQANTTNVHNAVGFTPADAVSGCIGAKYFLKHGKMEQWQIDKWIRPNAKGVARIAKYWRQLDEAAQARKLAQNKG